jgi:hypothetical protein
MAMANGSITVMAALLSKHLTFSEVRKVSILANS